MPVIDRTAALYIGGSLRPAHSYPGEAIKFEYSESYLRQNWRRTDMELSFNLTNRAAPFVMATMLIFSLGVSGTLGDETLPVDEDQQVVPMLFGDYRVVAIRSASGVESTADTDADLVEWIGNKVSFGDSLQWVDGSSCNNWFARKTEQFPLNLADPNLSDLAIEPLSPPAYHVFAFAEAFDLYCDDSGSRHIGSLIRIDGRVLVTQSASGSTNLILERPLSPEQVGRLQEQLKDMKFYDGEITGELDEATVISVGFYAEYRGSEYRFLRTAITENLLDGLGVLDDDGQ